MAEGPFLVRHNLLDIGFFDELYAESRLLKELSASLVQLAPEGRSILTDLYLLLYKKVLILDPPAFDTIHSLLIDELAAQSGLAKLRTRTAGNRTETHIALWVLTQDLLERLRGSQWLRETAELLNTVQDHAQAFEASTPFTAAPLTPERYQDFWQGVLSEKASEALQFLAERLKGSSGLAEQVQLLETLADTAGEGSETPQGPLTIKAMEDAMKAGEAGVDPAESFLSAAADALGQNSAPEPGSEQEAEAAPSSDTSSAPSEALRAPEPSGRTSEALARAAHAAQQRLRTLRPGTWSGQQPPLVMPDSAGPEERRLLADGRPDLGQAPIAAGIEVTAPTGPLPEKTGLKGTPGPVHGPVAPPSGMALTYALVKARQNFRRLNAHSLFTRAAENLDTLSTLMSHVGTTPKEMDGLPFDAVISLYKRTLDPVMTRFFNKVGEKRELAQAAQHRKKSRRELPVDRIRPDDDLDNVIDDELTDLALDIEAFENSFIDRFLHKSLLTRARVSRTARHKGPIILCYDGSGSMEGDKITETKAHILAFIEVARRQKRRMITIQFASASEPLFIREIHPSNVHFPEILELMDTFLSGGTDFERPLKEALKYLETDRFRNGDILFITDGICEISESFKQRFWASKADKHFHLYAVIIHGNTYQDYGDLSDIADEILEIRQRDLSDWNRKVSERIFSI